MSTDTITLFLALLAVASQAAVLVAAVVFVGRHRSPRLARLADDLVASVRPVALGLAAGVALVATAGSLYLSEGANFPPCKLCWYQRIAMYPLVPILAVAARRQDPGVRWYALPLAGIGGAISVYHVLLERFPSLETGACEVTNPCTTVWVRRFGYLTIPAMALSGFALIAVLVLVARRPVGAGAGAPADSERISS